jgi:hypothetical protein
MFSWKSSHCHLEKLGKSVDRNALKENPQVVTHKNGLARSPVDGVDAVIRSLIVQGKAANLHGPKKIRNCMRNWEKTCRKRNEKCVLSGERARIRALHGRFLPDPTSAGGDGDVKLRAESSTSWFWPRAGEGMAAWGPKSLKRKSSRLEPANPWRPCWILTVLKQCATGLRAGWTGSRDTNHRLTSFGAAVAETAPKVGFY